MANDGELKFGTKVDTSGFQDGVDDIKKKGKQATNSFNDGVDSNQKSLLSFKNVAKTVGAYIGVDLFKDALTRGVQFNAQVEQYIATFETFTGSVEEANKVVDYLVDLGAKTPFEFNQLADATQLMMSYGFSAKEATGYLQMLGDASGGNAEKLNSITTGFARMKSTGKVTLEYLNLMLENGFNPLQQVAKNTGKSMKDLYEDISDGKLSFSEIEEAIKQMTSQGGQYFGLMEKQSQTLNGQLSTLSDNINTNLGNAFQFINTFLSTQLLPTLNGLLSGSIQLDSSMIMNGLNMMVKLSEGLIQGIPNAVSNFLTVLQNIATTASTWAPILIDKGFEMLSNLVQGILNAIPVMIQQLPQIITTFANIINDNFPTILAKGAELLWQFITGILSAIPTLIANIPQIIQAIVSVILAYNWLNLGKQIIQFFGNGISNMVSFISSKAGGIFKTVVNALKNLPQTLLNLGKSMIQSMGNAIKNTTGTVSGAVKGVFNAIVNGFKNLPSKMINIGKNLVKGIWNGIGDMTGWIIDKIGGFADSVVDSICSFFGIHSPSEVMQKLVGKFLPMGIAVGFKDEMPKTIKDIDKSLELANRSISADLSNMTVGLGRNIAQPYYRGDTVTTTNNNQVINFYQKAESPDEISRRLRIDARLGLTG